jgi:hypothetical protein
MRAHHLLALCAVAALACQRAPGSHEPPAPPAAAAEPRPPPLVTLGPPASPNGGSCPPGMRLLRLGDTQNAFEACVDLIGQPHAGRIVLRGRTAAEEDADGERFYDASGQLELESTKRDLVKTKRTWSPAGRLVREEHDEVGGTNILLDRKWDERGNLIALVHASPQRHVWAADRDQREFMARAAPGQRPAEKPAPDPRLECPGMEQLRQEIGPDPYLLLWCVDDRGRPSGPERAFYAMGQLMLERAWRRGRLVGVQRYWNERGQLEYESSGEEGAGKAVLQRWHPNGALAARIPCRGGKPIGVGERWDERGRRLAAKADPPASR